MSLDRDDAKTMATSATVEIQVADRRVPKLASEHRTPKGVRNLSSARQL
jgi:hypothetical protein